MAATNSRKLWFRIFAGIVIAVLAIWCIAWIAASYYSERYLDSWIARESDFGRTWACKDRATSGFPVKFRFSCNSPSLKSVAKNGPLTAEFHALTISYSPLSPLKANIEMTGPLQAETPGNIRKIEASWQRLTVEASRTLSSPGTLILQGKNIQVKLSAIDNGEQSIEIGNLDSIFTLQKSGPSTESLQASIAAEAIAAPAINQLLGNTGSGKLKTRFEVKAFEAFRRGDPAGRLEGWRNANGAMEIFEFNFTKDRLAIETTGTLRIDALHRPAGQLNARAAGLTSLLEKLGIPGGGGARGGILGGLLRKPGAQNVQVEEPPSRYIPLPMTLREGYIWLGPIRTPIALRPLY